MLLLTRRLRRSLTVLLLVSFLAGCAAVTQAGRSGAQPVSAGAAAYRYRVQRFPPPGDCHARGAGLYIAPDPHCTPGALNPSVTQATIGQTICRRGWTSTIRPPASVTEPEKRAAISAYGGYAGRRLSAYELDHYLPLSLGGAPNAAANLWPERDYPGATTGAYYRNPKDRLESVLRRMTCERQMTLQSARQAIVTDWVTAYHRYVR